MKLLLDTHVLLWGFTEPDRLPATVDEMIRSPDHEIFVSAACLWEIAIKMRSGRLRAPPDLPQKIANDPDYQLLPILAEHVWRVRELPGLHKDPFDQLLIAQALVEDMTIVTHDGIIMRYGVSTIAI